MLTVLDHEEIDSLLGCFVLGAVSDDEAAAVRAHLAACPACAAEVEPLQRGADLLRWLRGPDRRR